MIFFRSKVEELHNVAITTIFMKSFQKVVAVEEVLGSVEVGEVGEEQGDQDEADQQAEEDESLGSFLHYIGGT